MKKTFLFLLIFITSCQLFPHKYKYVQHNGSQGSLLEGPTIVEDSEIIKSNSDADAYSQAFEKFTIAKQVYENMAKAGLPPDKPLDFELFDEKGNYVDLNLSSKVKDSIENYWKKEIGNLPNDFKTPSTSGQNSNLDSTGKVIPCPVEIISSRPYREDDYSRFKGVELTYKNISKKAIAGIRFHWIGINAFGDPADMGAEQGSGGGFDDDELRPGHTTTSQWEIHSNDLKKLTKVWVYEVAFKDGSKWMGPDE